MRCCDLYHNKDSDSFGFRIITDSAMIPARFPRRQLYVYQPVWARSSADVGRDLQRLCGCDRRSSLPAHHTLEGTTRPKHKAARQLASPAVVTLRLILLKHISLLNPTCFLVLLSGIGCTRKRSMLRSVNTHACQNCDRFR